MEGTDARLKRHRASGDVLAFEQHDLPTRHARRAEHRELVEPHIAQEVGHEPEEFGIGTRRARMDASLRLEPAG